MFSTAEATVAFVAAVISLFGSVPSEDHQKPSLDRTHEAMHLKSEEEGAQMVDRSNKCTNHHRVFPLEYDIDAMTLVALRSSHGNQKIATMFGEEDKGAGGEAVGVRIVDTVPVRGRQGAGIRSDRDGVPLIPPSRLWSEDRAFALAYTVLIGWFILDAGYFYFIFSDWI